MNVKLLSLQKIQQTLQHVTVNSNIYKLRVIHLSSPHAHPPFRCRSSAFRGGTTGKKSFAKATALVGHCSRDGEPLVRTE